MRPGLQHRIVVRPARRGPVVSLLLGVTAALAIAGCGASVGGVAVDPATSAPAPSTTEGSTSSSTDESPTSTPEPTTEPTTGSTTEPTTEPPVTTDSTTTTSTSEPPSPAEPPVLAFGQSYSWANGIKVTVAAPKKYTPKDAAESKKYGKEFVTFAITLVNGSKHAYQAQELLFRADSGGESRGRRYYDGDLPSPPEISLVPGQSATWTWAYGLSTSSTVAVLVAADSDSEEVSYALDGTGRTTKESGSGSPLAEFIGVQKLGGKFTFASGISVGVGTFKAYTPGEDAYGEKSPRYLQTTLTVTNGSRETITPTALSYGLAEKTVQRVQVRARSQKIGSLPEGRYPPGLTFTVKIAFGLSGTAGLVLDVRFRDSGSVVFTNLPAPVYSITEPGAKTPTPPTSGGTAPGPVSDDIAVRGAAQVAFGSKITWTNGVTALVSKPASFTARNTTRQPRGARAVKYSVTITNGSREPITSILLSGVVSGGFSCESVVDSASGVGDAQLSVEPGKTATLTLGCWAKDPADVVVQLRPDQPFDVAWVSSTGPQKPRSVAASKEAEGDEAERKFGDTFVYASGISVAVRTRSAVPVGAVAGDGTTYLAVEGTFTNNTDTPFRLSGWSPKVFDGDAAAETFYNERDFIGPASGLYLLPGRSLTLAQGAILKQPDKISVTSRDPSYEGPTITWTP